MGAPRNESAYGPNGGLTEILIPAGYVTEVYDYTFALSEDRTTYVPTAPTEPTRVPAPGMPFSLVFRAEPGKEDVILDIASAYEAASDRRVLPPAFGPIPRRS
jgi:Asp-tRNA(Asn)/Glu-tRNA(Gln) amidotransferase A subunit family amidase